MKRWAGGEFLQAAAQLEDARLEMEGQGLKPAGNVTLGSGVVAHDSALERHGMKRKDSGK